MRDSNWPSILVVEDQEAVRRQVLRTLETSGFHVIEAGDAIQGLSLLRENPGTVALAIIDFQMPGMSGLDMAAELIREYPAVKILYMSGNTGSVGMQVIARSSPEAVIAKPFTAEELLARVHLLLERPIGMPMQGS
jgi:DNA-binding response OmpR family regulator